MAWWTKMSPKLNCNRVLSTLFKFFLTLISSFYSGNIKIQFSFLLQSSTYLWCGVYCNRSSSCRGNWRALNSCLPVSYKLYHRLPSARVTMGQERKGPGRRGSWEGNGKTPKVKNSNTCLQPFFLLKPAIF